MIHELSSHAQSSVIRRPCSNTPDLKPLTALDEEYVTVTTMMSLFFGGLGIVSPPRKRATALLAKSALTLPHGDMVETGCYYGTSAAIMLKILKDFDPCYSKKLWVFDSFTGLPPPTKEDNNQGRAGLFSSTEELFLNNMKDAQVYDEKRLVVTKGWFNDTLPGSPVEKISFLRLDGDLFVSTWDALENLYHRVVPGGYIYVDDYGSFYGCKEAIDKFRAKHKISETIHYVNEKPKSGAITFEAIWWVKRSHSGKNQ